MEKRKIFSITLGDLRGLKEVGYLSEEGLEFLERMEEDLEDNDEPISQSIVKEVCNR